MNTKQKQYSIRGRLLLSCVLIPIIVVLAILMIVFQFYSNDMDDQSWVNFQSIADSRAGSVTADLAQVRSLASTAGHDKSVQEYLFSLTQQQRLSRIDLMQTTLRVISETLPCVENVFVRAEGWSTVFSNRGGFELFTRVLLDLDLWDDHTLDESLYSRPYQWKLSEAKRYTLALYQAQPLATISSTRQTAGNLLVGVMVELSQLFDPSPQVAETLECILYQDEICESSRAYSPEEAAVITRALEHTEWPRDFDSKYYVSVTDMNAASYRHVTLIPKQALRGTMTELWTLALFALCAMALICALLMMFMTSAIMRPINQIVQDMRSVISGAKRIRTSRARELNILSEGTNYMLSSLEELKKQELAARENLYQVQLQQSRAEMLAYRTQINPHFFFNTLECMCSMARYFRIKPLEELTEAMSKSFAYSLREKLFVPLEKEIQHVENYMHIMDIRCPDKYRLRISCAEETREKQVLSLLLQPLVENSVSHGFRNYDKNVPCTVDLRTDIIEHNGQRLRIRFTDNGCGISPEELVRLNELMKSDEPIDNKHIGLSNIRKRLKLAYGTSSHLRLRSAEGCYLQIELIIPLEELERARQRMGVAMAGSYFQESGRF